MVKLGRRKFLVIGGAAGAVAVGGVTLEFAAPRTYTKVKNLPSILLDSIRFSGREKPAKFDFAVVDCDGTFYRGDSTIEALIRVYGKEKGRKMHEQIILDVKKGKLTIDQALIRGFETLANAPGGFNIHIWEEIMADFTKARLFRQGLIAALCEMQSKHGLRVIIATRASERSAKWIAKNTGLEVDKTHFLGTSCKTDSSGIVTELTELIGTENGRVGSVKSTTKITKASEILQSSFVPQYAVMISDDVLDRKEMLASGWGLLLIPADLSEQSSFQKASYRFGLYDEVCMDNKDETKLKGQLLKMLSYSFEQSDGASKR